MKPLSHAFLTTFDAVAREQAVVAIAMLMKGSPDSPADLIDEDLRIARKLLDELHLYVMAPAHIERLREAQKALSDQKLEDPMARLEAIQDRTHAMRELAESVLRQELLVEEERRAAKLAEPLAPETSTYQLDKSAWCTPAF